MCLTTCGFRATRARYSAPMTATVLVFTTLAWVTICQGADGDLMSQGSADLTEGRFSEAFEKFAREAAARPDDPEPLFFCGVASNRLGEHEEALFYFDRAKAKNFTHRDMSFERGWSLMRVGRYREAVEQLRAYEMQHPGRGQTMEFLGRAYLGMGRSGEAEVALRLAVDRDPSLEPTVKMTLALIEQKRGRPVAAAEHIQTLLTEMPEAAPSRVLRERLGRASSRLAVGAAMPEAKRWRAVFSAGFGYTDNVISASDDVPLPTDISGTDSVLGRFGALLSYDLIRDDDYTLQVGYGFSGDEYESQFDTSDYQSHSWYADYVRRLNDTTTLNFRVADQYLNIGGSSFRNAVTIRPGLTFQWRPEFNVAFAYTFTTAEYFFPVTTVATDRDGESHTGSATVSFRVPSTELSGQAGVFGTVNETDGSDYDGHVIGGFMSLAHPLPFDANVEVTYSRLAAEYDNANSFAGFAFARDDDIDVFSVELSKQIDVPRLEESSARIYLRYDLTNNESDIATFNYDQYVISGGIVIEF